MTDHGVRQRPHSAPAPGRRDADRLPATVRGRRSRAAIVEAAATLMYERGIAATSLDEVLAHCGAGKSQLYHYFGNKQDLVRAVIAYQLEQVLAGQPGLHGLHSWDDFDGWAATLLARHSTDEGPLACRLGGFAGELDTDDVLRGHLAEAFSGWQSYLERGLSGLRDRGELRADADPALLAVATMAAVQGGLLLSRVHRDVTPLREALRMAIAHLHTFQAPPGRAARKGR